MAVMKDSQEGQPTLQGYPQPVFVLYGKVCSYSMKFQKMTHWTNDIVNYFNQIWINI